MDADIQKQLRAPFPADAVGKLPRVTCRACSDSRSRVCDQHRKQRCEGCANYITTSHIHLDYVGHAAVTDRLLAVDPEWTWEPLAFGQDGLPAHDRNGGLWIRLTVAGVTRLGYGAADGKSGADAVKEMIGDALRNAAMRFGVALDLWHKDGPLPATDDAAPARPPQQRTNGQTEQPATGQGQQRRQPPAEPGHATTATSTPAEARGRLAAVCQENGWDRDIVAARYANQYGEQLGEATDVHRINAFTKLLFGISDTELKAPAQAGAGT